MAAEHEGVGRRISLEEENGSTRSSVPNGEHLSHDMTSREDLESSFGEKTSKFDLSSSNFNSIDELPLPAVGKIGLARGYEIKDGPEGPRKGGGRRSAHTVRRRAWHLQYDQL